MSLADVPWPPPSAVAVRHQYDLSRSPFLRHVADLYWTSHLPEHEREQVLDHMALYDLRHSPSANLARARADRALLADLAAFNAAHPVPAPTEGARREGIRPRPPRRYPPRIPHLRSA